MGEIKYALIGCGRIAPYHLKAALENGLTPVAVCDLLPDRANGLLDRQQEAYVQTRCYTDYRELLVKECPTLVTIATESGSHASIALDAIHAGAHVIIEKPIALNMADARAIVKAGREAGVQVCTCHQNRFNLAVQTMRHALEQGRFGRLSHGSVHVRWNRNQSYFDQAPWRGTWAQDGGCLMNQCIHGIDLLRWMLGDEIEEVYGQTRRRFHNYLEAEDVGMAVLWAKNGAIATIEGTTNVYPSNLEETLCLFGEAGTVRLGGASINTIEVWKFAAETLEDAQNRLLDEQTQNVYGNGHGPLYADMLDAIREGRAPYIDGEAGARALELVLAIYESQRTGLPVKLPLADTCSTMDMVGIFG